MRLQTLNAIKRNARDCGAALFRPFEDDEHHSKFNLMTASTRQVSVVRRISVEGCQPAANTTHDLEEEWRGSIELASAIPQLEGPVEPRRLDQSKMKSNFRRCWEAPCVRRSVDPPHPASAMEGVHSFEIGSRASE